MTKKITEKRVSGTDMYREGTKGTYTVLRRMLDVPAPGKRWRGRQETRWKDSRKRYGKCGFKMEDVLDRISGKRINSETIMCG